MFRSKDQTDVDTFGEQCVNQVGLADHRGLIGHHRHSFSPEQRQVLDGSFGACHQGGVFVSGRTGRNDHCYNEQRSDKFFHFSQVSCKDKKRGNKQILRA